MKYHDHLLAACAEALTSIFFDKRHADKCIEFYFRNNKKWGSRDRRFFAETVYDCVRWWRLYWFMIDKEPNRETIELIGPSIWHRGLPLLTHSAASIESLSRRFKEAPPAIKQSVPDWLYEQVQEELGEEGLGYLPYLNQVNKLVIRVNNMKVQKSELKNEMHKAGYPSMDLDGCPDGLIFPERLNVFATPFFKQGMFEVQDGSSQQVADYLDIKSSMRVIDACAGAGGKSLHIADKLKNGGKVIALDIHDWKLQQLKLRARRNSYSNIEMKTIEGSKTIKRMQKSADRLLLDVPCSGLGVLRRNPDSKWKLNPQSMSDLRDLQAQIIQDYSSMLKPGGRMVYSTCSILPSENQHQVQKFLQDHPEFKLLKQRTIYPVLDGYDGFFMALLEKS